MASHCVLVKGRCSVGYLRRIVAASIVVGSVGVGVAARRSVTRPRRAPRFDPATVARIETEGWRAYYDRRFLDGLRLLLELGRDQFGLGSLGALRAAYYAVRGQMAFAGADNDPQAALMWMTRYYAATPRRPGPTAAQLAEAELDYWRVHRELVHEDDKTGLVDALARLHALLFGGSPEAMRPSAEQRTLACNAVDRITSRRSTDPDEDWRLVRAHLTRGYELAVAQSRA